MAKEYIVVLNKLTIILMISTLYQPAFVYLYLIFHYEYNIHRSVLLWLHVYISFFFFK